jgi:hypothetical protein
MLLDICFARSRFCSGVPALPSTVIGALIVIGLETAPDPPDRAMEAPTVLAAVTKPPFAEVDLTTLLSRRADASPYHRSQSSRTSHGTLRPFVFTHGRSHSLSKVGAFMDFDSYTQTLCSADTKRNAVAYFLESRWSTITLGSLGLPWDATPTHNFIWMQLSVCG